MISKAASEQPRRAGVPLVPDWGAHYWRDDQVNLLARAAVVIGRATSAGNRNQPLDAYVPPEWSRDHEFERVLRAASSPLTSATAAALSTVSVQFLRALVPFSAGAALLASGTQISFDGAGAISFPTLVAPAGLPVFISEGSPIPSYNLQSGAGVSLSPCLFAASCSATNEMLYSAPAETLIRAALLDVASVELDAWLFSTAADVPGTSPPGLLAGLTPLLPSAATAPADAMANDILALVGAVAAVAGNSPIAIVCGASQAAALRLRTAGSFDPIFTTHALAASKTVLAIATQALVSAADAPRIDSSQHTLSVENTVPAAVGTPGSPPVVGAPLRSYYQTDSVSLRLRWPISWVLRDSRAAAVMNSVTW